MLSKTRHSVHRLAKQPSTPIRHLATEAKPSRKEGDISSAFTSLSGAKAQPLPGRFANVKRELIQGHENRLSESWKRLLTQLEIENKTIRKLGPAVVPQIQFKDLNNLSEDFIREMKKRGVAVIKSVVPEDEARSYKTDIEKYVKANPSTKGFPANDPQVFELYWSASQVKARAHPNMLEAQTWLMNMWHAADKDALISTSQPLVYADRLRIRQPGDSSFALGPHIDGGSVERWEPTGYGLGGVYDKIFQGRWDEYDPWEAGSRVTAVSDLYHGSGSCSMFRMFQGWLGLSHTAPNEGTLMVNPLLQLATAYFLLRPFFEPRSMSSMAGGQSTPEFLNPDNWTLKSAAEMSTELHGAQPGTGQELTEASHPHLDLSNSMVHVPKIVPGDFVVWHCDTIHAVDKTHAGTGDSSVMYIPVVPVTQANVDYLRRQRETFVAGEPGPDFPGGKGETDHVGRPTVEYLAEKGGEAGLRAMGLASLKKMDWEQGEGASDCINRANQALGF